MTDALATLGLDPEAPRTRLLLAIGDDSLVTGHVSSRLAASHPDDPDGPQFAQIGTQGLTHAAKWFHVLVSDGIDPGDARLERAVATVAMGRPAEAYTHAVSCETRPPSFAHQLTRHWLFEHADAVRLVSLTESTDATIGGAALELLDAKRIHLDHATTWIQRFAEAEGGPELLLRGLTDEFRSAFEFFEEIIGEADAVAAGVLPVPHAVLLGQWLDLMVPAMAQLGLDDAVPDGLAGPGWDGALDLVPRKGGRQGEHTRVWHDQLWPEISERRPR